MKKRKSNHTCNVDIDTKKKPKKKKKKNGFDTIHDDYTKVSSVSNQLKQQQHPTTISITKEDHDKILQLLQSIDWDMAKNTSRRNVIRQDDPNTPKLNKGNNKPYCQSFIFGRNMKDPIQSLSYWSTQYPYIYQEFQNLIQKYNHQFTYTHITVNKNLQCKRHTDGGNAGLSYIIGFGNYTGGELQIDDDVSESSKSSSSSSLVSNHTTTKSINTKSKVKTKIYNLYRTFVLFNGKLQPHETLSFTGERYTVVYYTSDIVPKVYNHHHPNTTNTTIDTTPSSTTIGDHITTTSTTTTNDTIQVSETLTAKFNAMRKKLGRKR